LSSDAILRRLQWRCRRGMKELDQLLTRYLEQRWASADATERQHFENLLACEDDQLWRWFLGREAVTDPEHRAIVDRILQLA